MAMVVELYRLIALNSCNVVVWSFVLCSKKVMCKLFEAK
jgi:hypothetical protein